MKFKNIIVTLLFISVLVSFKTLRNDDTIKWQKDRKLTWEDFRGRPDSGNPNSAMTDSGFGFSTGNNNGDSIPLTIEMVFDKNKSWVKKKAETEKLLAHEQCHFDITELFTRKFKKQIVEAKFKRKTFAKQIHDLYEKTNKEWHSYQNDYDKETNHSKIEDKQQEWEEKVAKELNELNDFTMETIVVYIGK